MWTLQVQFILLFSLINCGLGSKENVDQELRKIPVLPTAVVNSPLYLLDLAKHESFVYNAFLNFNHDFPMDQLPNELRRYMELYMDGYAEAIQAAEKTSYYSSYKFSTDFNYTTIIAQNPVLAFKMVWRFADELKIIHIMVMRYRNKVPESSLKNYFVDQKVVNTWPTEKNVDDCIVGLLRLQLVYDLDTSDLASGIIKGIQTGSKLSVHQAVRIGEHAMKMDAYTLAIPWFELAINKLKASELNDRNIKVEDIEKELNGAISKHDENWNSKRAWNYYYYNHTLKNDGVLTNLADRVPLRKLDRSADRRKQNWIYNEPNFWSLCNGENHQTELEKSELYCWYETKRVPALTIFPIKMELLSKSPYIVQIYEIINASTMFKLLEYASAKMARSHVVDVKNPGKTFESTVRTSVEGWVYQRMPALDSLIETTTGLHVSSPTSAERYLVATYSFGGHYDCHLDSFENPGEFGSDGNRIATFMFYFIDTPLGGLTAFPQAGVAARPVKGSAVFWPNLKRNGERDYDTYHCACPVILGHKIISTKWIRHSDQFITRPCSLSKDE